MNEIKNRWNGKVICCGETIKAAAEANCADLRRAYLGGAKIAWQSHDLLSELLRRSAGGDIAKLKIAGLLLVCRDKCWREFVAMAAEDPLGEWALDALSEWVTEGDDAPAVFKKRQAANQ